MYYLIVLIDQVAQEPIRIWCNGEDQVDEVLNNRPEHHVIGHIDAAGDVEPAEDYIKRIKESR